MVQLGPNHQPMVTFLWHPRKRPDGLLCRHEADQIHFKGPSNLHHNDQPQMQRQTAQDHWNDPGRHENAHHVEISRAKLEQPTPCLLVPRHCDCCYKTAGFTHKAFPPRKSADISREPSRMARLVMLLTTIYMIMVAISVSELASMNLVM